jgi:hypothetical protein
VAFCFYARSGALQCRLHWPPRINVCICLSSECVRYYLQCLFYQTACVPSLHLIQGILGVNVVISEYFRLKNFAKIHIGNFDFKLYILPIINIHIKSQPIHM